jgi:putative ABC transport system permease protein
MTLLIGALTLGTILALLAIGVYLSFRIFAIADITVDGSLTLGASVTGVLLIQGSLHPLLATGAGFLAGMVAGMVTGVLQTRFRINPLLSGILVMTALYSVNLRVMGRSNLPFLGATTLSTLCEQLGVRWLGGERIELFGWEVASGDVTVLLLMLLFVALVAILLWAFLKTDLGTAMRASGDNPQMVRAMGGNVEAFRVVGLALANGLVGLAGSLWAQYQNFADAQMGIGMVVWGLASVIIGEAMTGVAGVGLAITGAILGSILFRELVAIALSFGLNPNDLKLVTAAFVFVALVLPETLSRLSVQRPRGQQEVA